MRTATARAPTNIALVKYFGKRDRALNLPASPSVSVTLRGLRTTTTVRFDDALRADRFVLDGRDCAPDALARVGRFLDLVREAAGTSSRALVESRNTFPTAAGLASSASGFAALALAATHAAGLRPDFATLATLARRGSGSAPRSLLGGFVEMPIGTRADGSDCVPRQVAPEDHWDLSLVVAVVEMSAPKAVGSTEGMERVRTTSPFYEPFIRGNFALCEGARTAILARDIEALGRVAEASCFRMHAAALAADPPILYWNDATVRVLQRVSALRAQGLSVFVTMDAGPHPVALCSRLDSDAVALELARVAGVREVRIEAPGPGASLLEAGETGPMEAQ